MNIYILGTSNSGKTPLARAIARKTGRQHIGASEWYRATFDDAYQNRTEFKEKIDAYSLRCLREDFDLNIKYLGDKYDFTKPSVIEGLRNPHDFMYFFRPANDAVINIDYWHNPLQKTVFETGLDVIRAYTTWLVDYGLMEKDRIWDYTFECFYDKNKQCGGMVSLEEVIEHVLERIQ